MHLENAVPVGSAVASIPRVTRSSPKGKGVSLALVCCSDWSVE